MIRAWREIYECVNVRLNFYAESEVMSYDQHDSDDTN